MKEIIEGEITYIVSDNYPEIPYQKAAKGEAVKRKILTRYEFRALFTIEEKAAIITAAKTDPIIEVFNTDMMAAEQIDLTYPDVTQGLAYLVAHGLITQQKMDNILAGV